jgi:hypothetical protein
MRRFKQSLMLAAAVGTLFACANIASAQVPSPGYIFLEAIDQADKPVFSAAAVTYDESGNEVASSVTDKKGEASLFRNSSEKKKFVFRVIKSGYLTYEGIFETSGQYDNVKIKIRLISASRPGTKEGKVPEPLPPPTTVKPKRKNYHGGKSTHFSVIPVPP